MNAEDFYNCQREKKPFTKLTKTGISDNLENVFEFAEMYHKSRIITFVCDCIIHPEEQNSIRKSIKINDVTKELIQSMKDQDCIKVMEKESSIKNTTLVNIEIQVIKK